MWLEKMICITFKAWKFSSEIYLFYFINGYDTLVKQKIFIIVIVSFLQGKGFIVTVTSKEKNITQKQILTRKVKEFLGL